MEGDLQILTHQREPQEPANGDGDTSKSWMARMLSGELDLRRSIEILISDMSNIRRLRSS